MKTLLKTQIPALALMLTFVVFMAPLFLPKAHSQSLPQSSTLEASADIFVSPSTTNGNRRMLFVGTYEDPTVCDPEGCPPVYSQSISYLNFDLPTLADDLIITSAKLELYHYGSNAEFSLNVAEVTSNWNEITTEKPTYSNILGSAVIPEFNTNQSNQIQLREINLDLSNFDGTNFANGFALLPQGDLNSAGVVFCSKDSDDFCTAEYAPRLVITTQVNNAPAKPKITNPATQTISGNCDYSTQTGICQSEMSVKLSADNIADSDPGNGALDYTIFNIQKSGAPYLDSHHFSNPGTIIFETSLEDGRYYVSAVSYDKRKQSTSSDKITLTIDTTPPSQPVILPLAAVSRPSNNIISINISAASSTDNLSQLNQIQYKLQYSTDSAFASGATETNWQSSSQFSLSEPQILPDRNYFFRIKAMDIAGNISDWSDTAATSIEGLPLTPIWNKDNWGINDGIKADGIYPEIGRLNPNYVIRGREINIVGKAESSKSVQIFVNNKIIATVSVTGDACISQSGRILCNFYFKYTFPSNGANYSNGVPINYYGFQFRTVDELNNASLLSKKETIYLDNAPPQSPTITNSLPSITNQTVLPLNIVAEKYADVEYKIFKQVNNRWILQETRLNRINAIRNILDVIKLGSQTQDGLIKNCIRNINKKSLGTCSDGLYRVEITIYDAPGNKSVTKTITTERDTVQPEIAKFETIQCGSNICANIEGEKDSIIEINGVNYGNLDNGSKQIILTKNWRYNTNYKFNLVLKDSAGNISVSKQSVFNTPLITAGGRGGYPEPNEIPQKIFNREISDQIIIEVDLDVSNHSYNIRNVLIPAPILEDYYADYDGSIKIYGVTVPKTRKVKVKLSKHFSSYSEAYQKCYIERWSVLEWKPGCINKEMGYGSAWETNMNCWYGQCIFNRKVETTELEVDAREFKAKFYRNDENDIFIDFHDLDNGKFDVSTWLNNPVISGDKVSSRLEIAGSFNIDGTEISFDGKQSDRSNQLTIQQSSYISLNNKPAKVIDTIYLNQWINSDGTRGVPPNSWQMCGAASSVMALSAYKKLPLANYSSNLRDYIYKDEGQGIIRGKDGACNDGAFGVTGKYQMCSKSDIRGMSEYLSRYGVKTTDLEVWGYTNSNIPELSMMKIKNSIDNNNPVIFSYNWRGLNFGHIALIRGYTLDSNGNVDGLVFNDSFRNIEIHPLSSSTVGNYSLDGEKSVYSFSYDPKKKAWIPKTDLLPYYMLILKNS